MAEETKGNSTVAEERFNHIVKVMKENEEFLRRNAEETYGEVIGLTKDAINFVGFAVKRKDDYIKRSTIFFLYNILMPLSYAIYTDLLIGNLPACFMELRLMLESLVKCYLADLKYPKQSFFQEKLELLEKENVSTSKLMKELGEKLGLKNDFIALWGKLSKDWIHPEGVIDKIISQTPSWALVIPINYAEDDLDTINELCKRVSQFKKLLRVTIDNYKQEFNFEEV